MSAHQNSAKEGLTQPRRVKCCALHVRRVISLTPENSFTPNSRTSSPDGRRLGRNLVVDRQRTFHTACEVALSGGADEQAVLPR